MSFQIQITHRPLKILLGIYSRFSTHGLYGPIILGFLLAIALSTLAQAGASALPARSPATRTTPPPQEQQVGDETSRPLRAEISTDATEVRHGDIVNITFTIENISNEIVSNIFIKFAASPFKNWRDGSRPATLSFRNAQGKIDEWIGPAPLKPKSILQEDTFSLNSSEQLNIKYDMRVAECGTINRWLQVIAFITYNNTESTEEDFLVYENLLVIASSEAFAPRLLSDYRLLDWRPQYPPGSSIHHEVRVTSLSAAFVSDVFVRFPQADDSLREWMSSAQDVTYAVTSSDHQGELIWHQAKSSTSRFMINFLNPSQTLIVRWTSSVDSDAPDGAEVISTIGTGSADSPERLRAVSFTVSHEPSDINRMEIEITASPPSHSLADVKWGEIVRAQITIINFTNDLVSNTTLDVSTPLELRYISGSTVLDSDSHGQRTHLPDRWLAGEYSLPVMMSGERITIEFFLQAIKPKDLRRDSVRMTATLNHEPRKNILNLFLASTDIRLSSNPNFDLEAYATPIVDRDNAIFYETTISNDGDLPLATAWIELFAECGISDVTDMSLVLNSRGSGGNEEANVTSLSVEWVAGRIRIPLHDHLGGPLQPGDRTILRFTTISDESVEPEAIANIQILAYAIPGAKLPTQRLWWAHSAWDEAIAEATIPYSLLQVQSELTTNLNDQVDKFGNVIEKAQTAAIGASSAVETLHDKVEDIDKEIMNLRGQIENLTALQNELKMAVESINTANTHIIAANENIGEAKDTIADFILDNLPVVIFGEVVGAAVSLWLFWHVRARWAETTGRRRLAGIFCGVITIATLIIGVVVLLWSSSEFWYIIGGTLVSFLFFALATAFIFAYHNEWQAGWRSDLRKPRQWYSKKRGRMPSTDAPPGDAMTPPN